MKKILLGFLKTTVKEVISELFTNAALKDKLNPETLSDIEEIYKIVGRIIDRKK